MINNSKEFLQSLVNSKKEVSIILKVLHPNDCGLMRGRIVWFDDDSIGVEFVKKETVGKELKSTSPKEMGNVKISKKVVLYFKSAIDSIDPGWEKEEPLP